MKGKPWSAKAVAALKRRYPHERTDTIAADLGVTVSACYHTAVDRQSESVLACYLGQGRVQGDIDRTNCG